MCLLGNLNVLLVNSPTSENEKQQSDSEIEVDLSQEDCTEILILSARC